MNSKSNLPDDLSPTAGRTQRKFPRRRLPIPATARRSRRIGILRNTVLLLLIGIISGCGPAKAVAIVVNSNGDGGDSSPGDGSCRTSLLATECTLRAALEETNARAGTQLIHFNLPAGDLTITPANPLPDITDSVIIDGTSQPGYSEGAPIVILDGSALTWPPFTSAGFIITAGTDATLIGLQISHFPGNGIKNHGDATLSKIVSSYNRYSGLASSIGSATLTVSIADSDFINNTDFGIATDNTNITLSSGTIAENQEGGIGLSHGAISMTHTQIRGNTSDSSDGCGGVCAWDAHGSLTGVVIEDNDAHDVGGGIKFESDDGDVLMVTDSTIRNNGSNEGGGVYVRGGAVHLNNSALTDNRAGFHGGGIYARSYITAGDTTVWVERGTRIGQAGHGNVANAAPSSSTGLGGGIYSEAILRISDSTVEGNIGDGILNSSVGSLFIQNSIVRGNSLGGIYSSSFPTIGTVQISNTTIQGNTQAGIYASNADLFVIGSLIDGNSGGGLQQNRGTLNFSYSTVSGNSVLGIGGGIGAMDLTSADISHSTISGNSAGSNGGGLYLSAGSGTVRNVTISGNHADAGAGGGMVAGGDSITLNNVTIAQNSAYGSGGLLGDERLTIKNSIIAGNTPYNCGAVEPYVSGGHNLDDGTTCGLSGPGDLSGVAAMLGPLQDNGGSSLTHALLVDSPAIDAGNDATCLPLDQRNVVRPQGAHCDMGAFEMISASATPTPTRTPYPTGTATAAILPTHTPTATGTSAKVEFDPVTFSAGQIFQGGKSCTPRDVTVRVRVSPPEAVASVGLFFRLEAKQGGQSTPWGEGLKMAPQGNGWYQLTISSGDLPNIMNWQSDAWMEFQFVANNMNGRPFAWSAVYRNVTLSPCYK